MSPPVLAQVTSLTRLSVPGLRLLTRHSALLGVPYQIAPRAAPGTQAAEEELCAPHAPCFLEHVQLAGGAGKGQKL